MPNVNALRINFVYPELLALACLEAKFQTVCQDVIRIVETQLGVSQAQANQNASVFLQESFLIVKSLIAARNVRKAKTVSRTKMEMKCVLVSLRHVLPINVKIVIRVNVLK